jgi:hypothetical protein
MSVVLYRSTRDLKRFRHYRFTQRKIYAQLQYLYIPRICDRGIAIYIYVDLYVNNIEPHYAV